MIAGTRAGKRSASGCSKRLRLSVGSGQLGFHLRPQMSQLPLLLSRSRPHRPTVPRLHLQIRSPLCSRRRPKRNGQGAKRLDLLPPIPGDVLFSGGSWPKRSATLLVQKSCAHPFVLGKVTYRDTPAILAANGRRPSRLILEECINRLRCQCSMNTTKGRSWDTLATVGAALCLPRAGERCIS